MVIYPKIFADYQQRSFQSQTTSGDGQKLWFTPTRDTIDRNPPTLILVTESGLAVQYVNYLQWMNTEGAVAWQIERDPGMRILSHDGTTYFLDPDGDVYGVDAKKDFVLKEFFIPNSTDRGAIYLFQPRGDGRYLIQTYNTAEEVEEEVEHQPDDHNLMLQGSGGWSDWKWLLEFEGKVLPCLLTSDLNRAVQLDNTGRVRIIDVESGEQTGEFIIEGAVFADASLDREDALLIHLLTAERERKLCRYNLEGTLLWEHLLPPGQPKPVAQPPAVDTNNRVYLLWNNFLMAFDNGELL